jgi:hypothetical protein
LALKENTRDLNSKKKIKLWDNDNTCSWNKLKVLYFMRNIQLYWRLQFKRNEKFCCS